MRHLLTLFDLTTVEIGEIFQIASDLKDKFQRGVREPVLAGHSMGLLFDKPSLRTRVSFEAGMTHLGGSCHFLGDDVGWGKRESIKDFTEVISQYVDVLVCRTRNHDQVEQLVQYSSCSVINGLTSVGHPCQALTDLFTMREIHGTLEGKLLAYIGDGNNVARSLAVACAKLGVRFSIAAPQQYQLNGQFVKRLHQEFPGFELNLTDDPQEIVSDASCIYTDVWASMGQEAESSQRRRDFADYQVNASLMALAPAPARFLHCLPAHRGEEVTDEVIDGSQSAVVHQAANRLHLQKGILVWLLANSQDG